MRLLVDAKFPGSVAAEFALCTAPGSSVEFVLGRLVLGPPQSECDGVNRVLFAGDDRHDFAAVRQEFPHQDYRFSRGQGRFEGNPVRELSANGNAVFHQFLDLQDDFHAGKVVPDVEVVP